MSLQDWLTRLRERPVPALATAIGVLAVLFVAWPWLSGAPSARDLVAKVNRAYAREPGYASTIDLAMPGGHVQSRRVTRVEAGRVVAFSEQVGPDGGAVTLFGIATLDGIWVRSPSRNCWFSSGSPEAIAQLHLGEQVIPTSRVRYEGPTRASGAWKLTVVDANSRRTFLIDSKTSLIRSIESTFPGRESLGSSTETIRPLDAAPQISDPTVRC